MLPDRGLILDRARQPRRLHLGRRERALQLFTPEADPADTLLGARHALHRDMADLPSLRDDLSPWKASLDAAVRNGELYSQPIPITGRGVQLDRPAVRRAGRVRQRLDDILGGRPVLGRLRRQRDRALRLRWRSDWRRRGKRVGLLPNCAARLPGSAIELPSLPDGIGLSLAYRRATRSGPSEGLPIEDIGISGETYALTRDDLLAGNRDLIAHCIGLLGQSPATKMAVAIDRSTRTITVKTSGLSRVDAMFDGHPGTSTNVSGTATTALTYPAGTNAVDLSGWIADQVHQRRRVSIT